MNTKHRAALLVAAALITTCWIQPLSATSITPVTDQQLVKTSELIFQGVVVRIDNRISRMRTSSEGALPHTFVTFRVEKVFKGRHTGQSDLFTLRLLGGPDSTARRFMQVEGCTDFDIGERVVLFVRANERSVCPVVGWTRGRFRIINGNIFSDNGREVWLTRDNKLAFGAANDFAEVRTHHRGGAVFEYRIHDASSSEALATPNPIVGKRLTPDEFVSFIGKLVSTLHTPSELLLLPAVKSAAPDDPFYFTQPRAVGETGPQ